ncbi:Uma2 family endonuclease [Streptomyces tremellae]|uniref:Uma2 family endonuclease n=1 Tax=Streptomyces tremellae TaxID=1124239 RepID=A0ABP7EWV3_9ACTN
MTVMAERTPQVGVDEFERIAAFAAAETESVRLECIGGRIGVKGVPDGDHGEILLWLQTVCMQHRPDLGLYVEQGLRGEQYRAGRARPDGCVARRGSFAGQGEWADPAAVLMTVEVTSYDRDTDARDRKEKPLAYAAAGIPVHLLIDPDVATATVFSGPGPDGGYQERHTAAFGVAVGLPDPLGFVLATDELARYVR